MLSERGEGVLELRGIGVSARLLELHLHCRERECFKKIKKDKRKGERAAASPQG